MTFFTLARWRVLAACALAAALLRCMRRRRRKRRRLRQRQRRRLRGRRRHAIGAGGHFRRGGGHLHPGRDEAVHPRLPQRGLSLVCRNAFGQRRLVFPRGRLFLQPAHSAARRHGPVQGSLQLHRHHPGRRQPADGQQHRLRRSVGDRLAGPLARRLRRRGFARAGGGACARRRTGRGADARLRPGIPNAPATISFVYRSAPGAQTRTVTLASAAVQEDPLPLVQTLTSPAGRKVAYLLFNAHTSGAQDRLIPAIQAAQAAGVQDVVLDLRYNGGGYLYTALSLSSMLAGSAADGQVFEQLRFNDKRTAETDASALRFSGSLQFAETVFSRRRAASAPRACRASSCWPAAAPARRASPSSTACAAWASRWSSSARPLAASPTVSAAATTAASRTSRSSSRVSTRRASAITPRLHAHLRPGRRFRACARRARRAAAVGRARVRRHGRLPGPGSFRADVVAHARGTPATAAAAGQGVRPHRPLTH